MVNRLGEKLSGIVGAILMFVSVALTLTFNASTGLLYFSFVICPVDKSLNSVMNSPLSSEIPSELASRLSQNLQEIFRPEIVVSLSSAAVKAVRESIGNGVEAVFWTALLVSFLSIIMCTMIPERKAVQ